LQNGKSTSISRHASASNARASSRPQTDPTALPERSAEQLHSKTHQFAGINRRRSSLMNSRCSSGLIIPVTGSSSAVRVLARMLRCSQVASRSSGIESDGRRQRLEAENPVAVRPLACNLKACGVTVRSYRNRRSAHRPSEVTLQRHYALKALAVGGINGNGEDSRSASTRARVSP